MNGSDLELRVAWQQHVGTSPEAAAWFDDVLARHRQPGRIYHSDRHVAWVVRHVLSLAERVALADLGATVAAAFFHDVVYDPTHDDNEAVSANVAERALDAIGWPAARIERVTRMVLATAGHDVDDPHADLDTCVLLAADLGVLAAEPSRYAEYARAVRREYSHVDDDRWRAGRSAVLRALLARQHLFAPVLGLDEWEARARANLTAELAELMS